MAEIYDNVRLIHIPECFPQGRLNVADILYPRASAEPCPLQSGPWYRCQQWQYHVLLLNGLAPISERNCWEVLSNHLPRERAVKRSSIGLSLIAPINNMFHIILFRRKGICHFFLYPIADRYEEEVKTERNCLEANLHETQWHGTSDSPKVRCPQGESRNSQYP